MFYLELKVINLQTLNQFMSKPLGLLDFNEQIISG